MFNKILKRILLIISSLAILSLGVSGTLLMLQLRTTTQAAEKIAIVEQQQVSGTMQNVNALLIQLGLAADQVRTTAVAEKDSLSVENKKMQEMLNNANTSLTLFNSTLSHVDDSVQSITSGTNASLDSLNVDLNSLNKEIADTEIVTSHINDLITSPYVTDTLKHVDSTSAHVDSTMNSVDVAVKRFTKPGSMVKNIFDQGLDYASKLFTIF